MKMNSQVMMLIVAALFQLLVGAVTLTQVNHKGDGPIDIPGDGSSYVDSPGAEDNLEDPEMPTGDLDVAAEAEAGVIDEEEAAVLPPPSKHKQHVRHAPAKVAKVKKALPKLLKVLKAAAAPKASAKRLRAAAPKAAASVESSANLRKEAQKEHLLRVDAERLVQKLTKALNHTTETLKKKDQEVDDDVRAENEEQAQLKVAQQQLSAERAERLSAQNDARLSAEAAKVVASRLRGRGKDGVDSSKLKNTVSKLKAESEKLQSENTEAKKEIEKLRDNVDEAEAARKAKTEELARKVTEVELAKKQEKSDIAALQNKDQQKLKALEQHLKDEEANQTATFAAKSKKAQDLIAELRRETKDLNTTGKKLEKEITQEQQQAKQEQQRAQKAEAKAASEHKAFLAAEKTIAGQKELLSKDSQQMHQLQLQADQVYKSQQQIKDLAQANSALKQTNVERSEQLDTALQKLEDTSQTLNGVRRQLKETDAKIQLKETVEQKAHERVRQLFQALKEKEAQIEIHGEEVEILRRQLRIATEQKDVLTKELTDLEFKFNGNASEQKELEDFHAQAISLNKTLAGKDQELAGLRQQLKEANHNVEDLNLMKANLTEASAEQKDLVDQLSAAKQEEKDELAAAAAKEQELKAQLAAAYQREKELRKENNEQADALKKKDKEVHTAWEDEAKMKADILADALQAEQSPQKQDDNLLQMKGHNVTEAALLTGKAVLRSRNLQIELGVKDGQLNSALRQIQLLKAQMSAQDMQLELARQAVLHAASAPVPNASAQEAAAARTSLENLNGKLDVEERELNASKAELTASKSQSAIQQQELQALKDDHKLLNDKAKKLSAAVIKMYSERKVMTKEIQALKANVNRTEQLRQDALRHTAELEKAVHASEEKLQKDASVQAEKKAADEKEAAEKAKAKDQVAAAKTQEAEEQQPPQEQEQQQDQVQVEEQQQPQEQEEQQVQSTQVKEVKVQATDDDDDDINDGEDDNTFAATVPWEAIQGKLQKNLNFAGKDEGK